MAEFFNAISQEYPPLPNPARTYDRDRPNTFEVYEIAAHLETFRKTKSTVYGDIKPALLTQFANLIATPVCLIFNQTLNMLEWPEKAETGNNQKLCPSRPIGNEKFILF